MSDSDYSIVRPVESLQNIHGIAPAKRRQQRKQKPNHNTTEQHKDNEEQNNESTDIQQTNIKPLDDEHDKHSVDFCA